MTSRLVKTIKVTDETHKAIRVAAANEGVTMVELVERAVSEWVSRTILLQSLRPTSFQAQDGTYIHTFTVKEE